MCGLQRPGFQGQLQHSPLLPVWAHYPPSLKRSFSKRVLGGPRLTPSLGRRKGATFWTRAATDHVTEVARLLPRGCCRGPGPVPPVPGSRSPPLGVQPGSDRGPRENLLRVYVPAEARAGPEGPGASGRWCRGRCPSWVARLLRPAPGSRRTFPPGLGARAPAPGPATSKGKIQRALAALGPRTAASRLGLRLRRLPASPRSQPWLLLPTNLVSRATHPWPLSPTPTPAGSGRFRKNGVNRFQLQCGLLAAIPCN